MSRFHAHSGAVLIDIDTLIDIREIKHGIHTLHHHVDGERDDVDVARPFAVAEEGSFNPVSASKDAEFRSSNSRSPVIMGMERYDYLIPPLRIPAEILDHVSVHIRQCVFHRLGQVDYDLLIFRRLPDIEHGITYLHREIRLRG